MIKSLITTFCALCTVGVFAQSNVDTSFRVLPGEYWWAGVASAGYKQPLHTAAFSFDFWGDASQNQSSPLLLSNRGRWIWSDQPFRFRYSADSLLIDRATGVVNSGKAGGSLRTAYAFASKTFFPSSGKWPDSLLVKAPQYNLWIELLYDPDQQSVLDYAAKVVGNGFPPGVLMIDDNWSNYYGAFEFDKAKFPDAKKMTETLHHKGFKVMVWICPFISPDSKAYRELAARKLLLLDNEGNRNLSWADAKKPLLVQWWNGYSACLDLTNPAAHNWLQEKLSKLQADYGIDGFKLDAGDAYFYNNPRLLSYKMVSPNAHTLEWAKIGLVYPLNEYRAMWKMAGEPLVQRLADKAHSWSDLQLLIPNTLVQQLMGYTFTCPDMIGGGEFSSFEGATIDQKLFVRSAQVHALMPMMQFSAAPWRVLDAEHLAAVKAAVALRQEKLPLIMDVLREAAQRGEPAVRSLEYNFPGKGLEEVKDQFMLGDKLMVAPVLSAVDERSVVFPKGVWKYGKELINGPATRTFTVPLNGLLYFEKTVRKQKRK